MPRCNGTLPAARRSPKSGGNFGEELESLPTPRSRFAVRGLLDSVGNSAERLSARYR